MNLIFRALTLVSALAAVGGCSAPGDIRAVGNGQPSRLFSSFSPRVVDTHFAWMEQAGIDGVGLQRFLGELGDSRFRAFRNQIADNVRHAAEKHGRIFYLAYDISGAPESSL